MPMIFLLLLVAVNGYRSIDGSGNNVKRPNLGVAGTPYIRGDGIDTYPLSYSDGFSSPIEGLPSARLVSNTLFTQPNVPNPMLNSLFASWALFATHDIIMTATGTESYPIPIPPGDTFFNFTTNMTFNRAKPVPGTGIDSSNPRQLTDLVTHFLDGSMVYGNDNTTLSLLRDPDHDCKLLTNSTKVGVLLPKNIENNPSIVANLGHVGGVESLDSLFIAGDPRVNVIPQIAVLTTLFVREHNRQCDVVKTTNPDLVGSTWFEEARRWVVAEIQQITFTEYFAATTGRPLPVYNGYQYAVNPSINSLFSTVGFRYGHSETLDFVPRFNNDRTPHSAGNISLGFAYFNPSSWEENGIEPVLMGMLLVGANKVDLANVDAIRNFLFGTPQMGGTDLCARDLQASRDRGEPLYNAARQFYGLPPINSFENLTSDPSIISSLNTLYNHSVDNMDAIVGGLLESSSTPLIGPLFMAMLMDQFTRLRDGDRFYYENSMDSGFTEDEIIQVQRTKLSDIILLNTNIPSIQCSTFYLNNPTMCSLTSTADQPPPSNSQRVEVLDGNLWVNWTTFAEANQIQITVTGKTTGWIALGLPTLPGRMIDADVVIGRYYNGTFSVVDYWIGNTRGLGCPNGLCADTDLGGTNNIFNTSGSQINGLTTFTYQRSFSVADEYDQPILPGLTYINLAMGTSNKLAYHGINKQSTSATFIQANGTTIALLNKAYLSTDYLFQWNIEGDTILGAMSAPDLTPNHGFLGLGFGSSMIEVDIIICRILSGGVPSCIDYYSFSYSPIPDEEIGGTNDIPVVSVNLSTNPANGWPMITFSRKLNTGDSRDHVITDSFTEIIFAHGRTDGDLQYHGLGNRGLGKINFFSGQTIITDNQSELNILYSHGVTMIACWFFLYPGGVFVARYLKHKNWWIDMHSKLQQAGTVGAISFAFLAFFSREGRVVTTHAALGIFIISVLIFQIGMGQVVLYLIGVKASRLRRLLLTRLHRVLGFVLIFSAPAQILLGIRLLFPSIKVYESLYIAGLIFVISIFVIMETYSYWQEKSRVQTQTEEVKLIRYPTFTWKEISEAVRSGSKWIVVRGNIYDISSWILFHPGGAAVLNHSLGTDSTDEFEGKGEYKHRHSKLALQKLKTMQVAKVKAHASTHDLGHSRSQLQLLNEPRYRHHRLLSIQLIARGNNPVKILRFDTASGYTFGWNTLDKFARRLTGAVPRKSVIQKKSRTDSIVSDEKNNEIPLDNLGIETQEEEKLILTPTYYFEMCIPHDKKIVERPYTPIPCNSDNYFELCIKIYRHGEMTKLINRLKVGDLVKFRGPVEGISIVNPNTECGTYPYLALIAAGAGVTPMLQIIDFYLKNNKCKTASEKSLVSLLVFDRTMKDIILPDRFEEYVKTSDNCLTTIRSLTEEKETDWDGLRGRPSESMLSNFLSKFPKPNMQDEKEDKHGPGNSGTFIDDGAQFKESEKLLFNFVSSSSPPSSPTPVPRSVEENGLLSLELPSTTTATTTTTTKTSRTDSLDSTKLLLDTPKPEKTLLAESLSVPRASTLPSGSASPSSRGLGSTRSPINGPRSTIGSLPSPTSRLEDSLTRKLQIVICGPEAFCASVSELLVNLSYPLSTIKIL